MLLLPYLPIFLAGRNEKGQLGVGDTENRSGVVAMDTMSEFTVVSAAVGRNHTLLLTDRGSVFACGDNKSGQCGTGTTTAVIHTPCRIDFKESKVQKVKCPFWLFSYSVSRSSSYCTFVYNYF